MKIPLKIACFILVILIASGFLYTINPSATVHAKNAFNCKDAYAIFARGSGEKLSEKASNRFLSQLELRLGSDRLNKYELGSQPQGGHQYPAVAVNNVLYSNAIGAWVTSGTSYAYGASVREGALELASYFAYLQSTCPESRIILGGYSQGAQVIGDTVRAMPQEVIDQIEYVGLFGDPKLNLPEGKGMFPEACKGRNLSLWRRTVGSCFTSAGSLGSRNPYLPEKLRDKTGLFCLANDFVCGSSRNIFASGHNKYAETDGAIDKAALEAASFVIPKITRPTQSSLRPALNSKTNPDIMMVVDTSNVTPAWRTATLEFGQALSNIVSKENGRIGLISACRCPTDDPRSLFLANSNLDRDTTTLYANLALTLSQDRSGTSHIDSISNMLGKALARSRGWSPDRRRIIVFVTNTSYYSGYARASPTVKLASSMRTISSTTDSTTVLVVAPTDITSSLNTLTVPNTTILTTPKSSLPDTAAWAQTQLQTQVIANLASSDYEALPGDTLSFDASPSSLYNDTARSYEWDFNGDGTYDQTTDQPATSHTYPSSFNGTIAVRVTSQGGAQSTTTASVRIATQPTITPIPAPTNLTAKASSKDSAEVSWQPGDNTADYWIVSLNDVPIAKVPKDQTNLTIGELDRTTDNSFGVRALTSNGDLGEQATILLRPEAALASMSADQDQSPFQPPRHATSASATLAPQAHPFTATPSKHLHAQGDSIAWPLFVGAGIVTGTGLLFVVSSILSRRQNGEAKRVRENGSFNEHIKAPKDGRL